MTCTREEKVVITITSQVTVADHRGLHIVNWNVSGLRRFRVVVLLSRGPQGFPDAVALHREGLPAQV